MSTSKRIDNQRREQQKVATRKKKIPKTECADFLWNLTSEAWTAIAKCRRYRWNVRKFLNANEMGRSNYFSFGVVFGYEFVSAVERRFFFFIHFRSRASNDYSAVNSISCFYLFFVFTTFTLRETLRNRQHSNCCSLFSVDELYKEDSKVCGKKLRLFSIHSLNALGIVWIVT